MYETSLNLLKKGYSNCQLCPRECGADRYGTHLGQCKANADFVAASICVHKGEEPVLGGEKGVVNLFFPHCNLSCFFCQNHQISKSSYAIETAPFYGKEMIVSELKRYLDEGHTHVGFVSPSHYPFHLKEIVLELRKSGYQFTSVYNSNGYDKVDTLKTLEEVVDIYLPDFKYFSNQLAKKFSNADNYLQIAKNSLTEMIRQKGTILKMQGANAREGVIVRHLVLPGYSEDSVEVLHTIKQIASSRVSLSLMSQYTPIGNEPPLTSDEYSFVVDEMDILGFNNGWVQELSSTGYYTPDFSQNTPFYHGVNKKK